MRVMTGEGPEKGGGEDRWAKLVSPTVGMDINLQAEESYEPGSLHLAPSLLPSIVRPTSYCSLQSPDKLVRDLGRRRISVAMNHLPLSALAAEDRCHAK